MALTELNFSRRYFEDEIEEQPLMPMYKEYDARLRSFQIWEDYEEKRETAEMFAKAGYYFISKERCNNRTGQFYYDALCFSCGSGLFVSKDPVPLYPYFPFHNLDCQFFKCPPEIMNSLTLPPLKTRPYAKMLVKFFLYIHENI